MRTTSIRPEGRENVRRGSCPCRCKTISLIHGFRTLQNKLAEERQKSLQLHTETEDLKEEIKRQENLNAAKIRSLSRYTQLKLSIEHFLSLFIIKFGYNARCHWLKERAL